MGDKRISTGLLFASAMAASAMAASEGEWIVAAIGCGATALAIFCAIDIALDFRLLRLGRAAFLARTDALAAAEERKLKEMGDD